MIKAWTTVFIRPSTDVLWWHEIIKRDHVEYSDYIKEKYVLPGKITIEKEVTDDGLILILTFLFLDLDAQTEFLEDPKPREILEYREKYLIEAGIQVL
jgi:hypothetical protein